MRACNPALIEHEQQKAFRLAYGAAERVLASMLNSARCAELVRDGYIVWLDEVCDFPDELLKGDLQ